MARAKVLVALIILDVVACSCGLTDDRESKAREFLQQRVSTESRGAINLDSFSKTNGYEQELMGTKMYVLEWRAEVSIRQDVWKGGNNLIGYWGSFGVMTEEPSSMDSLMMASAPRRFAKGTVVTFTGQCALRKTDNGWRVEDLKVKTSGVREPPPPKGESSENLPTAKALNEETARVLIQGFLNNKPYMRSIEHLLFNWMVDSTHDFTAATDADVLEAVTLKKLIAAGFVKQSQGATDASGMKTYRYSFVPTLVGNTIAAGRFEAGAVKEVSNLRLTSDVQAGANFIFRPTLDALGRILEVETDRVGVAKFVKRSDGSWALAPPLDLGTIR